MGSYNMPTQKSNKSHYGSIWSVSQIILFLPTQQLEQITLPQSSETRAFAVGLRSVMLAMPILWTCYHEGVTSVPAWSFYNVTFYSVVSGPTVHHNGTIDQPGKTDILKPHQPRKKDAAVFQGNNLSSIFSPLCVSKWIVVACFPSLSSEAREM